MLSLASVCAESVNQLKECFLFCGTWELIVSLSVETQRKLCRLIHRGPFGAKLSSVSVKQAVQRSLLVSC